MLMDAVGEGGGGFDNGNTPMSEVSLIRPTLIF